MRHGEFFCQRLGGAFQPDQRRALANIRQHAASHGRRQIGQPCRLQRAVRDRAQGGKANFGRDIGQAQHGKELRPGIDAKGQFGQHRQGAVSTAHQLGQIEAGDVLHHLGAAPVCFAQAIDGAEGQQGIARPAMPQTARAAGIGRGCTAQGGNAVGTQEPRPVGGIKPQALVFLAQHGSDFRQRRRRSGRDDQFRRLIFDDARKAGNIQHRQIGHRLAHLAAGAAGHDLERRSGFARRAHEVRNLGFVERLFHQ